MQATELKVLQEQLKQQQQLCEQAALRLGLPGRPALEELHKLRLQVPVVRTPSACLIIEGAA